MNIAHATTVHPRTDTRIRLKEAATLARGLDAEVALYVQDGLGDEVDDESGFAIRDAGPRPVGRLARMTVGAWRMYRALRRARPDVVHFHDPELIPVGIALRVSGTKAVYDVHEDLPRQILTKPYLPAGLRAPVSRIAAWFEGLADRVMSGVVPATPAIAEHFSTDRAVLVQNFPLPGELTVTDSTDYAGRPAHFAFVGGITAIRGTVQMIDALALAATPDIRLQLVGRFSSASHRCEAAARPGWSRVDERGWADRPTVAAILDGARAGLVLFLPSPNHVAAQPNKLFEYMSAGLPVIASDFPLWRRIVDGAGCGLLVDPTDPAAIARAMDWILDNPDRAAEMGRRGRDAVRETYNWPAEAEKLLAFYRDRLGVPLKRTE